MVYGDTTRARSLAGNPSTTSVSANDVTQAVAYGDSQVNIRTGKSTWSSLDIEYATVQTASEYFASSYIRDRFADKENKADEDFKKGVELCDQIVKNTASGIISHKQNYRTWPLNADATPYRSILPGNGATDLADIVSDADVS